LRAEATACDLDRAILLLESAILGAGNDVGDAMWRGDVRIAIEHDPAERAVEPSRLIGRCSSDWFW
jgi:hypothetical protein